MNDKRDYRDAVASLIVASLGVCHRHLLKNGTTIYWDANHQIEGVILDMTTSGD